MENNFANNLLILRHVKGVSLKDIEIETGIDADSIYKFEKSIASPTLDAVIKLANYFNVSLNYLVTIKLTLVIKES